MRVLVQLETHRHHGTFKRGDPSKSQFPYLAQHQEERNIGHAGQDCLSGVGRHPWTLRGKSAPVILRLGGGAPGFQRGLCPLALLLADCPFRGVCAVCLSLGWTDFLSLASFISLAPRVSISHQVPLLRSGGEENSSPSLCPLRDEVRASDEQMK